MSKQKEFNLDTLTNEHVDSISGRAFGVQYCNKIKLISLLEEGNVVKFIIGEKVKAINDSFIKGLFSSVFEKYKNINKVETIVIIESKPFYQDLFKKNWIILEAINNSK